MNTLVTFILKDLIVPWANAKFGSVGIPLPTIKGVQIVNPVLSLTEVDGCLTIGASIKFTSEADAVVVAAAKAAANATSA